MRILVNGSSLLSPSPAVQVKQKHLLWATPDEVVSRLVQYHDACEIPSTVVFEKTRELVGIVAGIVPRGVEVVVCAPGQQLGSTMARLVWRLRSAAEILVVTDLKSEQEMAASSGVSWCSCGDLVARVTEALSDLERHIAGYNQRERSRYGGT